MTTENRFPLSPNMTSFSIKIFASVQIRSGTFHSSLKIEEWEMFKHDQENFMCPVGMERTTSTTSHQLYQLHPLYDKVVYQAHFCR